jgi:hypothetical protein
MALALSACSPAIVIDRPRPQERLSRGELGEILSDRKSM